MASWMRTQPPAQRGIALFTRGMDYGAPAGMTASATHHERLLSIVQIESRGSRRGRGDRRGRWCRRPLRGPDGPDTCHGHPRPTGPSRLRAAAIARRRGGRDARRQGSGRSCLESRRCGTLRRHRLHLLRSRIRSDHPGPSHAQMRWTRPDEPLPAATAPEVV